MKRILIIDGEYLKKEIIDRKQYNLKYKLLEIFGLASYPNDIHYYGADKIELNEELRVRELGIDEENITINTFGYRYTYDNGRKVQKGVDTRIVLDSYKFTLDKENIDKVYLLSGDGDMFPLLEEYSEIRNEKMIVVSFEHSTAGILKEKGRYFNLNSLEDKTKDNTITNKIRKDQSNSLKDIEVLVREAYKENGKKWLSATEYGRLVSKDSKFKLNGIQKTFRRLNKLEYVELIKPHGEEKPELAIKFNSTDIKDIIEESNSLLKGNKISGTIIKYKKNPKGEKYFFIKSGEREDDIFLGSKDLDNNIVSELKKGIKLKFYLKNGSGKRDVAYDIEIVS